MLPGCWDSKVCDCWYSSSWTLILPRSQGSDGQPPVPSTPDHRQATPGHTRPAELLLRWLQPAISSGNGCLNNSDCLTFLVGHDLKFDNVSLLRIGVLFGFFQGSSLTPSRTLQDAHHFTIGWRDPPTITTERKGRDRRSERSWRETSGACLPPHILCPPYLKPKITSEQSKDSKCISQQ